MAVRIIKKSWYVDLRFNYQRYRKKSPENAKAGAVAYEAVLRQKLARGEIIDGTGTAQQAETFRRFSRKWFKEYVVPNNKPAGQRTKKYILSAHLVPFFGDMSLEEITTQRIEQYKAAQMKHGTITNKTINNHLSVLSKCLAVAHEWKVMKTPSPKVKWLKCPPPQTNYLSPEECELLLSHASGVVREMLLMALRTGMRQGELKGLQWPSVDWQNRSIVVRHSRCDRAKDLVSPKSNRERHIPLDIDVYEMLYKRKKETGYVFLDADRQPFDHKRLSRRMEEVCKKAGLRHITWHMLRHTFASLLAVRGTPLHVVQALLGHSTITTTMRYAHVASSALRDAINMLNPKTLTAADFGQQVGNQWFLGQQRKLVAKNAAPENPQSVR